MFPVSYQEMHALGASTGEAVTDFELGSLDRKERQTKGKEILPFLLLHDTNRKHAFWNKTKNICDDHVRCEQLEEFQQNKWFLKMYVLKKGGRVLWTAFVNGNLVSIRSSSELEKYVREGS